eukprot:5283364-Prymnesium_polylepis.1
MHVAPGKRRSPTRGSRGTRLTIADCEQFVRTSWYEKMCSGQLDSSCVVSFAPCQRLENWTHVVESLEAARIASQPPSFHLGSAVASQLTFARQNFSQGDA